MGFKKIKKKFGKGFVAGALALGIGVSGVNSNALANHNSFNQSSYVSSVNYSKLPRSHSLYKNTNSGTSFNLNSLKGKLSNENIAYIERFLRQNFNSIILDQKDVLDKYINGLQRVYQDSVFRFDLLNSTFGLELNDFAKQENVSLRLAAVIAFKESRYTNMKQYESSAGAIGNMQVKPILILDQCKDLMPKKYFPFYDYLVKYERYDKKIPIQELEEAGIDRLTFVRVLSEVKKDFYDNPKVQFRASLKFLKSIANRYKIDVSYDVEDISIESLVVIAGSYNRGFRGFRENLKDNLLTSGECSEYIKVVLAFWYRFEYFVISDSLKIVV